MSELPDPIEPGTLCSLASGIVVRVVCRLTSGTTTESYLVETVDGRPFASMGFACGDGGCKVIRNESRTCAVYRRNLRPLDPKGEERLP